MNDPRAPKWPTHAAAAMLFGVAEWTLALRSAVAGNDVARSLAAAVGIYVTFGLVLAAAGGLVARLGGQHGRAGSLRPSVGLAPSMLLFLAVLGRVGRDPVSLLAAVSAGGFAYIAISRAARRFPVLRSSFAIWTANGLVLILAVGMAARSGGAAWLVGVLLLTALGAAIEGVRRSRFSRAGRGLAVLTAHVLALTACGLLIVGETPIEPVGVAGRAAPAVLLVTIDTLRADRVGCYGSATATTPNLDALARQGVRFAEVLAQSPWTGPSHASILTGLLPQHHGVRFNSSPVPESVVTLADDLHTRGYVAGAFVGGWPLIDESFGLASRFEEYDDDLRALTWFPEEAYRVTLLRYLRQALLRVGVVSSGSALRLRRLATVERDAEAVTNAASVWMRRVKGRSFLAWVHYYDPHLPYTPPDEFRTAETEPHEGAATGDWYSLAPGTKAEIITDDHSLLHMLSLHDSEVTFVDHQLGRLLEAARSAAPEAGLLIAVTADHGESFGEHGLFFFRDLYEPTLRVPLIFVAPESAGISPRQVEAQVRSVDIVPTILDLLGVSIERELDGTSLTGLMRGQLDDAPGPAYSVKHAEHRQASRGAYAVRHRGWKLIHRLAGWRGFFWEPGREELYDLSRDPGELWDLAAERPQELEELQSLLEPFLETDARVKLDMTPAEIDKLRALGYLN